MTNILCLFKAAKRLFSIHAYLQNFWPRAGSHIVCLAAADLGMVQRTVGRATRDGFEAALRPYIKADCQPSKIMHE